MTQIRLLEYSWIFALLPQIMMNFRRRSASGLSPALIVLWLFGDASGLIGAFLTHQLVFQKVNCIWHLLCDAVLCLQWLIFHSADSERIKVEDKREDEIWQQESIRHRTRRLSLEQALSLHEDTNVPMYVSRERPEILAPRAPLLPPLLARTRSERKSKNRRGRRTQAFLLGLLTLVIFFIIVTILRLSTHLLDALPFPGSPLNDRSIRNLGRLTAWLCALLYLGSRFPQIYHNYARQSCQGLSLTLFLLASVANICYCLSVYLSSRGRTATGELDKTYFVEEAPFLVTAGGALLFDQIIMAQYLYYNGWTQPDPRHRLEPTLERRQELINAGLLNSGANTPAHGRVASYAESHGERTPLLRPDVAS